MVQWYAPWDHLRDQIQDRFFWHFLSLVLLRKFVFHAHTKLARRRGTVLLHPLCNCNVFQHTGLFGLLQSVRARRFYNPRGPNKSAERMGKITETQIIGKTNRRNSETQQIGGTNRRGRPNSAAGLGGGGGCLVFQACTTTALRRERCPLPSFWPSHFFSHPKYLRERINLVRAIRSFYSV